MFQYACGRRTTGWALCRVVETPDMAFLIDQVNERFLLPHDLLHSINGLLPFFMSNVEACVRMSAPALAITVSSAGS